MSNPEHVQIAIQGTAAIERWRSKSRERSFPAIKARIGDDYARILTDPSALNLEGAVLRGMDLAGAQLWYANLRGADLTEARLVGADLRYALLIGAFLEHADLSGADLTRAVLVGAKLAHSQLVGATLSHSLGPRVDLRCSILDDATLDHAMMQEADLREVMLRRASLLGCKVPRSDLRGAVLEQVNLRNADLYEAQLQGANLKSADLRWANLSAANLESASLQEANLEGAMVVWQGHFGHLDELPNYNPASFFGADITNANLEGIIPLEQASLIRIVSGLRHPKVAFRSERVRQAPQATRERLVLRTAEGELEEGRIETSLIRLDALWKRAKELEQDLRARIAAARKMALAAIKAEVPAASATAHGLDVLSVSDADLLGILEAAKSDKTTSTAHISIVGRPPRKIRQRFISFLKAEIRAISFDDGYRALVATTPIAHHLGVDEAALPRSTPYDSSSFSEISRGAGSLIRWSANHAWPAALAAQIQALANVFFGNFIGLKQKYGVPVAGVFVISDSARTLPRKVFERFASMGQFETGHVEVPYHLQDIILAKYLRDASKNRAGLTDIGYASDQVEALHDGHIIGIPFDEIGANTSTFGALPANEINVANPTHLIGTMPETKFLDGWIVDSMYNTLFTALAPDAMGLYGAEDIGRDHFASVRAVISPVDDVRVKHYSIPVFHAHSIDELRTLVGLIGDGAYFRGQTKGYTLDRPLPVRQLLYGSSTAVEPSLVTAASRHGVAYDRHHSRLQLIAQSFLYEEGLQKGLALENIRDRWRQTVATGSWDAAVMALGQHYGIPTPGLDITSSLEVALWFATNKFTKIAPDQARYVPLSTDDWLTDSADWPTLYILRPVTRSLTPSIQSVHSIEDLGLDVVRPRRQAASFFMGGHGTHLNRAAEALAAIVRLGPAVWPTGHHYRDLFPLPDSDPAYCHLLEAKRRYRQCDVGELLDWIVEYVD